MGRNNVRNLGKLTGQTNFAVVEYPVANGVTVTDGDFVKLVAERVTNADIDDGKLLGTVNGSNTQDFVEHNARFEAAGNAAGTVKVLVELATDNRYEIATSADLSAANVGQYFDISGTTGEQQVDVTSANATGGQLLLIERVETADGEYKKGVFVVADNVTTTGEPTA